MSFHKRSLDEIIIALKKTCFRMKMGDGPVVVYPDEFLCELFTGGVHEQVFFETISNVDGKQPMIKEDNVSRGSRS